MKIKIEYRQIKAFLIFLLIVLIFYFFFKIRLLQQTTSSGLNDIDAPSPEEQPAQTESPQSANEAQLPTQKIEVLAKQFEFVPNEIRVSLGDIISLRLISQDVTHGFSLPEFGIDEVLEPGSPIVVSFQATKKGEFPFFCSVPCGSGHDGMRGRLIVN